MKLTWFKCKEVGWCDLQKIDIENEYVIESIGVFVCWTGSEMDNTSKILKVGQGFIYDVILELRKDKAILAFENKGIYFTWARCASYHLDRVEVFLNNHYKPVIPNPNLPKSRPKKTNLPWDEEEIRKLKEQLSKPSFPGD
jgi:hypothetical protein